MNKKKLYTTLSSIAGVCILSIFLYNGALKMHRISSAKNELSTINSDSLSNLRKVTGSLHAELNDFVCWGKSSSEDKIPWDKICGSTGYANRAANLIDQNISGIKNPMLITDYKEFLLLLNKAAEEKDPKLLIYAHRIIHDLDYWILNGNSEKSKNQDYWKATITLEGPNSSFQKKLKKLHIFTNK